MEPVTLCETNITTMKKYIAFIMLSFSFVLATAQDTFIKSYNGNGEGYCAKETMDGGIIGAGMGVNWDLYLWKTDTNGDTVWTRTYGGGNGTETGRDVVQKSNGGYFVVGTTSSFGAGNNDIYAISTDMNGDLLWSKTFGGADDDFGLSVVQTSDSGFLIAGYTFSFGAGNSDILLVRLNFSGDTLWTKTIGGASFEFTNEIQNTSDGGFIISGSSNGFGVGQSDILLIKLNSNGAIVWSKTFGKYDNQFGGGVQQTADGGYILSGYMDAGNSRVLLLKTDSLGNQIWTKKYGNGTFSNASRECSCVQVTPGGGYIFTTILDVGNFFVIKTDGNGILQTRNGFAVGNANSIHPVNGGFVVCGTFELTPHKPVLVKVDTNGYSCFYSPWGGTTEIDTFIETTCTPVESYGCTVTSPATVRGASGTVETVCSTLGISEEASNNQLLVFPNPSNGYVTISFENVSRLTFIRVFNTLGEIVFEKEQVCIAKSEIAIQNLSPGIYYAQLIDGEKCATANFIVR